MVFSLTYSTSQSKVYTSQKKFTHFCNVLQITLFVNVSQSFEVSVMFLLNSLFCELSNVSSFFVLMF
jgi:hypothetical protein